MFGRSADYPGPIGPGLIEAFDGNDGRRQSYPGPIGPGLIEADYVHPEALQFLSGTNWSRPH